MKVSGPYSIYTYDGSIDGFFCVVFHAFQSRIPPADILSLVSNNQIPIGDITDVVTCHRQAARVRKGIVARSDEKNLRLVQVAHLAETRQTDMLLYRYLVRLFEKPGQSYYRNMLDPLVYDLVQAARRVKKEVHRFHGFVRFQQTRDNMYVAAIDPDNNIVRLLAPHFTSRFPHRKWLIYDVRRKYGIFHDTSELMEVKLEGHAFELDSGYIGKNARAVSEDLYRELWQTYYDSVNIKERKNSRQMRAFMPKRYWKYLPEKSKK